MTPLIALVDCNSFYCNCERVFRPELRNTPIVVLSNNDGCAVSRTPGAKALGIAMGAPYFQIKDLCKKHGVEIFSSNFSLYTDLSRRVMTILKEHSPKVEVYSVDEAFLDFSGIPNPVEHARFVKEEIWRRTKIPVSIGLGPTKVLCKIACRVAKKNESTGGVFSVEDHSLRDRVLEKIQVGDIWGVAKGRALSLKLLGIKTAKQFRDYPNDKKIQKVLTKVGRQIQEELRGNSCFPLTLEPEKKKEIMSSRTFGRPVFDKRSLQESIASHASEVAEELRLQKSVCKEVQVYMRTNPFKEEIVQYGAANILRFETPSNNTFAIIKLALRALDEIWRPGLEYKKSGVRVMGLQDEHEFQMGLFEASSQSPRQKELMSVMDRINTREGKRTVFSLACGIDHHTWKMRRDHCSPRYTTSWNQIPTCNDLKKKDPV